MTAPPVDGPGVQRPAGDVVLEPARRRVRALVDGIWVIDSDDAITLYEQGSTPRWYVPVANAHPDLLVENGRVTPTTARGPAHWSDLHLPDRVIENAAWTHPEPPVGVPRLDGLISFEWNLLDAWFEEDDEIIVHPRSPYTRIDVLRSSRHVRVELDGMVLADTKRPLILLEGGHNPARYYLSWSDVDASLLEPSDSFTACPYKGIASYWNVRLGDVVHHDLLWEYRQPMWQVARIAGHVCPFNEFVDMWIDGVRLPPPETKWAHHGPNAYTWRPGDEPWDPRCDPAWRGDEPHVDR